MSASLVGSEMCIRDSNISAWMAEKLRSKQARGAKHPLPEARNPRTSVSYTHLTLPTICSV
eukprot:8131582-Alexandrium_andersonii.AAC.1